MQGWTFGGIIIQQWQQEDSNSSEGNILLCHPTSRVLGSYWSDWPVSYETDVSTDVSSYILPCHSTIYDPTNLGGWGITVIAA